MKAVIRAEELTRKFGGLTAVDSASFEVMEGEILGFLGPNGAGKTTTIRMLAGIIAPTSGRAEVAGLPIDHDVEKLHEAIGLLTESPGFYERLSAIRNLEYFAGFYPGVNIPGQVEKYLKAMGLWERREDRVGTFSKGMKQRLALARALLHEPGILFLDEPTAGLDPEAAQEVREMIKKLRQEGCTIFLSTHNLSEAESLCDRIAIIRTQLIALDTPENLRKRLFKRDVVVEMDSISPKIVEAVEKLEFVYNLKMEGKKLVMEIEDIEKNRPFLVKRIVEAGGMVQNVYEEKHSLEEVYLSLIHEDGS